MGSFVESNKSAGSAIESRFDTNSNEGISAALTYSGNVNALQCVSVTDREAAGSWQRGGVVVFFSLGRLGEGRRESALEAMVPPQGDADDHAPPQPSTWASGGRKSRRDDFASAYAPVSNGTGTKSNPFEVYDADLDDGGADSDGWEAEAVGSRSEPRPWQPRFYSIYFDVNVGDVAGRLVRSIFPFKPLLGWVARDEDEEGGTSVPDLYGPVWITTTAVLALSMGSTIKTFLENMVHGAETTDVDGSLAGMDFTRLWKAASVLYFYVFFFPLILIVFQFLFARQSLRESNVSTYPILGSVMVYGYSMTPVVIAAFVATIPIRMVQLVSVGVAFALGICVILLNLWRDVSVEYRSLTYFVRIFAGLAHAAVGVVVVTIFYSTR